MKKTLFVLCGLMVIPNFTFSASKEIEVRSKPQFDYDFFEKDLQSLVADLKKAKVASLEGQITGYKKRVDSFCREVLFYFDCASIMHSIILILMDILEIQNQGYGYIEEKKDIAVSIMVSSLDDIELNLYKKAGGRYPDGTIKNLGLFLVIPSDYEMLSLLDRLVPLFNYFYETSVYDNQIESLSLYARDIFKKNIQSKKDAFFKSMAATALHKFYINRFLQIKLNDWNSLVNEYKFVFHGDTIKRAKSLGREQNNIGLDIFLRSPHKVTHEAIIGLILSMLKWMILQQNAWASQPSDEREVYLVMDRKMKKILLEGIKLYNDLYRTFPLYEKAYYELRQGGFPELLFFPPALDFSKVMSLFPKGAEEPRVTEAQQLVEEPRATEEKQKDKRADRAVRIDIDRLAAKIGPLKTTTAPKEKKGSVAAPPVPDFYLESASETESDESDGVPSAPVETRKIKRGSAPKAKEGYQTVERSLQRVNYSERVHRRYLETRNDEALRAYHNVPLAMDPYIIKYGDSEKQKNMTHQGKYDTVYSIGGIIEYSDKTKERVLFSITKGVDGRVYHRGVIRRKSQDDHLSQELDGSQALDEETEFSFLQESNGPRRVDVLNDPFCTYFVDKIQGIKYVIFKPRFKS